MKSLIEHITEMQSAQSDNNIEQLSCNADLYEAILDLNEKLNTTLLAIADLYETLIESEV